MQRGGIIVRKTLITLLAASLSLGAAAAFAQDYPNKAVSYHIGFEPGGESDRAARFQVPYFKKYTGQDLIIQYMPGAGGATLWSQLNNFAGDGYTLAGTILPHIILQPTQSGAYRTEDIVSVYFFHSTAPCLYVAADSPFLTIDDAVEAAREAPGSLIVAGTGTFTGHHIAHAEFMALAGIETTYVPYPGSPSATQAMLSGEAQLNWSDNTLELYIDGQLRPLACAAEERHPLFPDTATFRESGYDFVTGPIRGVGVPASTPEDIRVAISDIFARINSDPDAIAEQHAMGLFIENIPYGEIEAFVAAERARIEALMEKLGDM